MTTRSLPLVIAAVVGLGALALVEPAHALEGNPFVLPARSTVEVDQPPIPGQDPVSATGSAAARPPDPATCPSLPQCMDVSIEIEVPELNDGDDFFVTLTMTWDQASGLEDIDFWLYDDGQIQQERGESGYTEVGSSASGDMPEVINVYAPTRGLYHLVAINFSGTHTGWHISATSTVGEFTSPFESLAQPTPGQGTTNPGDKPTTTTTRPTPAATTTTVSIPEGAVLPDDDFDGDAFAEPVASQEALDAIAAIEDMGGGEDSSPAPLTVVLWMVVLPAAVIAGAAAFVVRSRRSRRGRRGEVVLKP